MRGPVTQSLCEFIVAIRRVWWAVAMSAFDGIVGLVADFGLKWDVPQWMWCLGLGGPILIGAFVAFHKEREKLRNRNMMDRVVAVSQLCGELESRNYTWEGKVFEPAHIETAAALALVMADLARDLHRPNLARDMPTKEQIQQMDAHAMWQFCHQVNVRLHDVIKDLERSQWE